MTKPAAPIEPLGDNVDGRYEDDLVVVQPVAVAWPARSAGSVRTCHFDVAQSGGRLVVTHAVPHEQISDDLTGLLVDELFAPGWVRGSEMFERIFTGVVRSSSPDAHEGWELFYRNTIRRLEELSGSVPTTSSAAHGTIEGYAPVYVHADALSLPGSVLEVGCCFGFLSLRLARTGRRVTASDVSPGTVRLLGQMARRLGLPVETLHADAGRLPLAAGFADTVLAVHLLEHLDRSDGDRVLAEAVRCATRRVVVGVPLEDEPDESYGHVRTVSLDDLRALGEATGHAYEVHEHHGGWLVVDRV